MCKSAPVDTTQLAEVIRRRLDEIDRSAESVSREILGGPDGIKRIYQGHKPSFDRACKILSGLGLVIKIGHARTEGRRAKTRVSASRNTGFAGKRVPRHVERLVSAAIGAADSFTPEEAEELQVLVAAINAHWLELGTSYARQDFLRNVYGVSHALREQGDANVPSHSIGDLGNALRGTQPQAEGGATARLGQSARIPGVASVSRVAGWPQPQPASDRGEKD